jgi:hypothetical protein
LTARRRQSSRPTPQSPMASSTSTPAGPALVSHVLAYHTRQSTLVYRSTTAERSHTLARSSNWLRGSIWDAVRCGTRVLLGGSGQAKPQMNTEARRSELCAVNGLQPRARCRRSVSARGRSRRSTCRAAAAERPGARGGAPPGRRPVRSAPPPSGRAGRFSVRSPR